MNLRTSLALAVSSASLFLTACGTTGSTATISSSGTSPSLSAAIALASAGGDILSGAFGHQAVGASTLNFSSDNRGNKAKSQADNDYRSYVSWKSTQRS